MFSISSQTSGFGLRQSVSSVPPTRNVGRQLSISTGGGTGRRNPTLTLRDLETSGPFENLKNIEKSSKSNSKFDEQLLATMPTARVSFMGTAGAAANPSTLEPMKSLVPGHIDVKHTAQTSMTSPVPRHTEVPRYPEVLRFIKPFENVKSIDKPRYPEIPQNSGLSEHLKNIDKPRYPEMPRPPGVPRYAEVLRYTEPSEHLKNIDKPRYPAMPRSPEVPRYPELPRYPGVPRYTDVKPSMQETTTSLTTAPDNGGIFCPGKCITLGNLTQTLLAILYALGVPGHNNWKRTNCKKTDRLDSMHMTIILATTAN